MASRVAHQAIPSVYLHLFAGIPPARVYHTSMPDNEIQIIMTAPPPIDEMRLTRPDLHAMTHPRCQRLVRLSQERDHLTGGIVSGFDQLANMDKQLMRRATPLSEFRMLPCRVLLQCQTSSAPCGHLLLEVRSVRLCRRAVDSQDWHKHHH